MMMIAFRAMYFYYFLCTFSFRFLRSGGRAPLSSKVEGAPKRDQSSRSQRAENYEGRKTAREPHHAEGIRDGVAGEGEGTHTDACFSRGHMTSPSLLGRPLAAAAGRPSTGTVRLLLLLRRAASSSSSRPGGVRDVAIVGGGPTGLLLSSLLSSHGVSSQWRSCGSRGRIFSSLPWD